MPFFRILFLAFLVIPLIEIYLLIQVGEVIGAGWTVFLVVATAALGVALLRHQGLATLHDAQARINRGELPATSLFEGVMLLLAGALLLTPGFFTDTLGFLLLVPIFRKQLAAAILRRGMLVGGGHPGMGNSHHHQRRTHDHTIEGEYKRKDD